MKKKKDLCPGGMAHPSKPHLLCWGNHHIEEEGHWTYIVVKGETRRVSWRD